jgi:hypothetical protein
MIFGGVDMFGALLDEVLDRALGGADRRVAAKQQYGATHGTTLYGQSVSICAFSSIRC